ncbi:thymidylate synthase (FAD) [Desulfonispora thiosulfatigenes DSM 11270]|uniref:Flavin-dependent thymidylate synthase n=1 Tax=Desulfonispora thiosulfatigenes DSM 11270 TaxID=656914 RepID=A0A1W1UTM8_DESTI|nr:FAD-dependent thymidylate synthase [Desulfonispora thiosulfatigenes]SMB84413.1 thymidylate synthase (FAD) [Desulfonispora thiosulfatigenes DSM 11270]
MGKVSLKVELLSHTLNPEETIAMGAKLCYSKHDIQGLKKGIEEKEQSAFIAKLLDMGHLSPIEHATFTFGIEGVSRSLLAQLTRHRIASFSVKSQRYVTEFKDEENTFNYIVPPKIEALGEDMIQEYEKQMKTMQEWYNFWQEKLGQAGESTNEDARFILPNAAETKIIVTMNARELIHFFSLRCCNRAQWEIRALAKEMLKKVQKIAPSIFVKVGPSCLTAPCPEGKSSCGKMEEVRQEYNDLLNR